MIQGSTSNLSRIASQVRRDIVRMVHKCQSGHPGGSLGCTDFMVALYFHIMKHDPSFQMDGNGEDLFFYPTVTFRRCGIVYLREAVTFLLTS